MNRKGHLHLLVYQLSFNWILINFNFVISIIIIYLLIHSILNQFDNIQLNHFLLKLIISSFFKLDCRYLEFFVLKPFLTLNISYINLFVLDRYLIIQYLNINIVIGFNLYLIINSIIIFNFQHFQDMFNNFYSLRKFE
jgi:hypothetical protein